MGALLLVFVGFDPGLDAGGRLQVVRADLGELAVSRELGDRKIDRAVLGISVAFVQQHPDDAGHLGDVLGGPGIVIGRVDAQRRESGEKFLDEGRRVVVEGQPLGFGVADGLIVHIRQVHDMKDAEPGEAQCPLEQVLEDISPVVADMGDVVDRRSAGVKADLSGDEGFEILEPVAERIIESKHRRPL